MNTLTYKGYTGKVEYDPDAEILFGEVIDLRDTITFKAKTADTIKEEFYKSVDEYLAFCTEIGRSPDKPYSGNLTLRTTPELHRKIAIAAKKSGKSANEYIESVLSHATQLEMCP